MATYHATNVINGSLIMRCSALIVNLVNGARDAIANYSRHATSVRAFFEDDDLSQRESDGCYVCVPCSDREEDFDPNDVAPPPDLYRDINRYDTGGCDCEECEGDGPVLNPLCLVYRATHRTDRQMCLQCGRIVRRIGSDWFHAGKSRHIAIVTIDDLAHIGVPMA